MLGTGRGRGSAYVYHVADCDSDADCVYGAGETNVGGGGVWDYGSDSGL